MNEPLSVEEKRKRDKKTKQTEKRNQNEMERWHLD